jgi:hypothetical protein
MLRGIPKITGKNNQILPQIYISILIVELHGHGPFTGLARLLLLIQPAFQNSLHRALIRKS